MSQLDEFKAYYGRVEDLKQSLNLLSWDQHVYMPQGAAETRAQQLSTLSSLIHEYTTSQQMKDLLAQLARQHYAEDSDEGRLLARAQRSVDQASKLPAEFVETLSRQRSKTAHVWLKARAENNFKLFEKELAKIYDLVRQQADYLGYETHPYDALHDQYEMGSTVAALKPMFAELREETVELLKALGTAEQIDDALMHKAYDTEKQRQVSEEVARRIGFDFEHGRLDPTVHPFAQDISKYDVRITTKYVENWFASSLFGTMHEAGHGMYEQGIADAYHRGPLGAAVSLGVHESQSRLYENLVGRSYAFWQGYYPRLQAHFPAQLSDTSLDDFYRAINKVEPSLIRIEADEVTYNLHILIRFELELVLLEGSLKVAELPEAWNEKYEAYLGITPPSDALGCLQDVHWSEALVGYFPTYTLGNLMSVQLFEAAKRAHPGIEADMVQGDFTKLLSWLRDTIHQHGSKYTPAELVQKATGQALTAKPYISYLNSKFRALYGLS
ncbi:MAG: carboxypeptidase M32 [Trueperaceae bacterium]|nr:carboxypeptidase M32 [Trueperaceae bacterium]